MRYQIDAFTGCWNFGQGKSERLRLSLDGAQLRPYRVAYALLVGPIPPGFHVHHKCGNPRCINPDHLQAVLPGDHARLHAEFANKATHCKRGHPWDEKNTYPYVNRNGQVRRKCRACNAELENERQRQRRDEGHRLAAHLLSAHQRSGIV